jgi:alpha-1,2-mannosyltransferase
MQLYTASLHHASFLMTNSTWTNAHVRSVLAFRPPALLSLLLSAVLFEPFLLALRTLIRRAYAPLKVNALTTRIVYPPCDTKALTEFPLENREPVILSIAQFRYDEIVSPTSIS